MLLLPVAISVLRGMLLATVCLVGACFQLCRCFETFRRPCLTMKLKMRCTAYQSLSVDSETPERHSLSVYRWGGPGLTRE